MKSALAEFQAEIDGIHEATFAAMVSKCQPSLSVPVQRLLLPLLWNHDATCYCHMRMSAYPPKKLVNDPIFLYFSLSCSVRPIKAPGTIAPCTQNFRPYPLGSMMPLQELERSARAVVEGELLTAQGAVEEAKRSAEKEVAAAKAEAEADFNKFREETFKVHNCCWCFV
jgi:hypothetical protein